MTKHPATDAMTDVSPPAEPSGETPGTLRDVLGYFLRLGTFGKRQERHRVEPVVDLEAHTPIAAGTPDRITRL
jgi:hypothetical protein